MYEQEKRERYNGYKSVYIKDIVFRVTLFHPFCVCVYIYYLYISFQKKKKKNKSV